MNKLKSNILLVIGGLSLLGLMLGCSAQSGTTVLSKQFPPQEEVVQPQDQPGSTAGPLVSDTKVGEKVGEKDMGVPPMDIPVEEPAEPTITPTSPEPISTAPTEGADDLGVGPLSDDTSAMKAAESPEGIPPAPGQQDVKRGIPPIASEPEKPAEPTIREEPSGVVAKLEPELIEAPEKEEVVPPSQVEQDIPPRMFEPELPAEPIVGRERSGPEAKPGPESMDQRERKERPTPGELEQPVTVQQEKIEEKPIEIAKVMPGAQDVPFGGGKEELSKTLSDVYFEYDRFSIREDAAEKLQENAKLLVAQLSDRKVVIEGHCDERGTQSYNMILGERRAQMVKEYLVDLGVPKENLEPVSFGKERPFCTDHSMECWQKNRRGHFVLE